MTNPWMLILPLTAALLYVAAALSLKRSADLGTGLWHTTVVCNVIAGLMFQGLLVFGGQWRPLAFWWQPPLVALLFLSGQIWTLLSLQRGDVSIATPVLGLKIILVAVFTTLLVSTGLSWQLWLAAALATCGIASLNHPGAHEIGANATPTILSAGAAAISFAMFDVLVQKFSPAWGIGRFLPLALGLMGLFSLALIPLFPSPLRELPQLSWRWLLTGGSLSSCASVLFVSGIGYFGQATAANVIYSSRGLWSIAAITLLGHWFHSSEKQLGASILRWRFFGAALMFTAIVLVLI